MWPIGCPETSVWNYQYSLRNNPWEQSSRLLHGGSLTSHVCTTCFSIEVASTLQIQGQYWVQTPIIYLIGCWTTFWQRQTSCFLQANLNFNLLLTHFHPTPPTPTHNFKTSAQTRPSKYKIQPRSSNFFLRPIPTVLFRSHFIYFRTVCLYLASSHLYQ
jgi:hypothetical protein